MRRAAPVTADRAERSGGLRARLRAAAPALALAVAGLAVACAEAPTGPGAPADAVALAKAPAALAAGTDLTARASAWLDGSQPSPLAPTVSGTVARYSAGDTAVVLIQVGTDPQPAGFVLGGVGLLTFPSAAQSICDPATSSYGVGTWDAACQGAAHPIRIVARAWVNAEGRVATDFQPALRFVPGMRKPVLLTLRDNARPGTRVDYCTAAGCVDESQADSTLATQLDADHGLVRRAIKHFSGYTVTADRKSVRK
jgi:hypothetical protein